MSVVETNRKQLEAIGDYVTRANVNWFAVFPEKLAEFEQTAAENNRESHLIVYRTRSANKRDHHVISISALTGFFTDDSLTYSDVNGSIRWNVTLRDHHAMCDYGAIKLVLTDLHVIAGHCIGPKFLAYHNDVVCSLPVDA